MVIFKEPSQDLGWSERYIVVLSTLFNYDSNKVYWFMLGVALITIVISEVFQRTRIHFAIDSIRADETVAKSHGSEHIQVLIFVFVVTS
jgi:branched-chain amino acid transport system permease protein